MLLMFLFLPFSSARGALFTSLTRCSRFRCSCTCWCERNANQATFVCWWSPIVEPCLFAGLTRLRLWFLEVGKHSTCNDHSRTVM